MSDIEPLSADELAVMHAVMHAATNGNARLINDPAYRQCVANGIRAAVDAVLPANDCTGMNKIYIRFKFLCIVKLLTRAHQREQP